MATTLDLKEPGAAAAVDLGLSTLQITGSDRQKWLNGLLTCDLAPLKPGQGAYGLATTKVGKILADVVVLVDADRLLVGCPPQQKNALAESFERYLVMEDAEVTDVSSSWAWLLAVGPGASGAAARLGEVGARWAAVDRTGLGDAAAAVPAGRLGEAWARLEEGGVARLDEASWLRLRVEHGVALFGVDFDDHSYPQEARLERRAVSFSKGCYLGQEVVCRLEMRGHVHRRLARLLLDGPAPPPPGAEVQAPNGDKIGAVSSAIWSPALGKVVALAMVKYAHSEPGSALSVEGRPASVDQDAAS